MTDDWLINVGGPTGPMISIPSFVGRNIGIGHPLDGSLVPAVELETIGTNRASVFDDLQNPTYFANFAQGYDLPEPADVTSALFARDVGIGTDVVLDDPGVCCGAGGNARLHVMRGQAVGPGGARAKLSALSDELAIESSSDDVGLSILTRHNPGNGVGGTGRIYFADKDAGNAGSIIYSHKDLAMEFYTETQPRVLIDGFGNTRFGPRKPSQAVPVQFEARVEIVGKVLTSGPSAGDPDPSARGAIRILDGHQAAGHVLTSDVDGVGQWKPLPVALVSGWIGSGSNVYFNTGAVLIGTTSTFGSTKLHVDGSAAVQRLLFKEGAAISEDSYIAAPTLNAIGITTNGSERMRVDGSGSVLIGGTSSNGRTLQVYGDAFCSACNAGGTWFTSSDQRLKTGIENIGGALDLMKRLRPVRFFYSEGYRSQVPSAPAYEQYGFIAQEFRQVFPNSVKEGPDGFLQLSAGNVLPYMVKGVQEMLDIIETQDTQIADQQRQIDAQQRQIDTLRALVESIITDASKP